MSKRNENRPGYKKTPVGWIPQEWGCEQLIEICNKSGEYGVNAPSIPYCEKNPRFIRITDISEDGQLLEDKKRGLDSKLAKGFLLNHGDFLFARTGATVGKSYLHKDDGNQYAFAGYLIRFVLNQKDILGEYLRAYTSTKFYWRWVILMTRSGAQPNINAKEYSSLQIPLPPIQEQDKILEILTNWNNVIDLIKKLIAAKQHLKIGLRQQLLTGRMRFSEFGSIVKNNKDLPLGWKKSRLGDCFKERLETNSDLTLLSITSDRGVIPRDEIERKDSSNSDKSKYKKIVPGDIGYNTMRMWQGVSAVSTIEGIVSPAYTVCSPKNGMVSKYFGYLFKYASIIHKFHRHSQGLVNDTLNLKFHHFAKIKINIPEKMEQAKIASFMSIIDQDISLLEKEIKILKEQQKGLFQKLLTGEIRHPNYKKIS